jgi:small conductance mechanosensitive channel
MEETTNWFTEHGIPILIVIVASFIGYQILKAAINRVMHRIVSIRGKGRRAKGELDKRSDTLTGYLSTVVGAIVLIIAIFMILSEVGVDIAPLIAGAGVAGIAIGFGAQSLIKDYLNGLFIVIEDQYNKGDVAKIAGIAGLVESVTLRRTVLRDLDGIVHSIPNGQITTTSNYTRDWARVNLNVSVGYGEDLDRVMAVIDRVGQEMADDEYYGKLIKTPPKSLRVNKFGDSGIDIKILGETKPIKQWEVTGELRRRLKRTFDEEGIEIPWPHVKLYFGPEEQEKAPGKAGPAARQRPGPFSKAADTDETSSGDVDQGDL